MFAWYLQVNDPSGDAHRCVIHRSKDKGAMRALMRRLQACHGRHGYMLCRYRVTEREYRVTRWWEG